MDFNKRFTVKNNPRISRFCLLILLIIFLIGIVYFILDPGREEKSVIGIVLVTLYLTMAIFVGGWLLTYRVTVNGSRIYVQKVFGLSHFDLDVSEISKVKWLTTNITTGRNDNITVFAPGGKSFKIESIMLNSDQFVQFLYENIEESKIARS